MSRVNCCAQPKLHAALTLGAALASFYALPALAAPYPNPAFPADPVQSLTSASDPGSVPAAPNSSDLPQIVLDYSKISGSPTQVSLEGVPGKPAKLTYANEFTVEAQTITGDFVSQEFTANGGVHIHELDTDIQASLLSINRNLGTVEAEYVLFHQHPYLLGAKVLTGNVQLITATHATFTTAPPGVAPVLQLRASKILFYPQRRLVVVHRPSFYLYHTKVLEIPYASYQLPQLGSGANGPAKQTRPLFGVSGRYGAFAGLDIQQPTPTSLHYGGILTTRGAPQLYVYASESLLHPAHTASTLSVLQPQPTLLQTLREYATADHGPLAYGDPLLFHDFLTDKNPIQLFNRQATSNLSITQTVTSSLPASGNNNNNLYVSKLPELGVHLTVPITPTGSSVPNSDHAGFRTSLRRFILLAHGDIFAGQYIEQPTNINESRLDGDFRVDTEPFLFARNTVMIPSVTLTGNAYSGTHSTYSYLQTSLAVNHYFTDRTALGFQIFQADTSGRSPFNFDTLDTTREFDTRLQLGNHKLAVEGLVRYDLVRQSVIGYKIAIAPTLPGVIPVLEFDSTSRSLGVDLQIEGITF